MLNRRNQLTLKAETIEGTGVTPASTDGFLGLDVKASIERNMLERRQATSSLGHVSSTIGRGSLPLTFGLDLKGRGTGTRPEFSLPLQMSGMRELLIYTMEGTQTGTLFVGETITQPSGTTDQQAVGRIVKIVDADTLQYALVSQRQFITGQTVTGYTSTATIATPTSFAVVANNYCYIPWSRRAIYVPLTGVLSNSPPQTDMDGYAFVAKTGSVVTGGGSVRRYDYTAGTKALYVDMIWGSVTDGQTVEASSTGGATHTGTVLGTPTYATGWVPSVTARYNRDGYLQETVGTRSTWSLKGNVGETGMFEFAARGRIGTLGDAPLVSSLTYQANGSPIRISGANFTLDTAPYGLVNNGKKIPYASFGFDMNCNVSIRPDGNQSEGDISAIITDRDPMLTIDPEWVPTTSLDLHSIWTNATLLTFSATFGTGTQTILFHALKCQLVAIGDGDRDNTVIGQLSLKPRTVHGDGDDELMIVAFSS